MNQNQTRIYVPPRRRRQLPIDGPDFGHVMLGAVLLAIVMALAVGGIVWIARSH